VATEPERASSELDYSGVLAQLWDWVGEHVAVTVRAAGSPGPTYALLAGRLDVEPVDVNESSGVVTFAVIVPGNGAGFAIEETAFASGWMTEPGAGRPGPVLTVIVGGLNIGVSLRPDDWTSPIDDDSSGE
jgi:hypothetical protein